MARIYRRNPTRRKRLAAPYYQGAQDFVTAGEPLSRWRIGTDADKRYLQGFNDAKDGRALQPLPSETLYSDRPDLAPITT